MPISQNIALLCLLFTPAFLIWFFSVHNQTKPNEGDSGEIEEVKETRTQSRRRRRRRRRRGGKQDPLETEGTQVVTKALESPLSHEENESSASTVSSIGFLSPSWADDIPPIDAHTSTHSLTFANVEYDGDDDDLEEEEEEEEEGKDEDQSRDDGKSGGRRRRRRRRRRRHSSGKGTTHSDVTTLSKTVGMHPVINNARPVDLPWRQRAPTSRSQSRYRFD